MTRGRDFSDQERVDSFERQYHSGQVYRLFCMFTRPPKQKRLILACLIPSPLLLYINSEIPKAYLGKPHLQDRQVLILAAANNCLEHDSYVDCTRAITELPKESIQGQVLSSMDRQLGTICEAAKQSIIKEIMRARTLELRFKERILAGLQTQD